jgi:hypothetical protein
MAEEQQLYEEISKPKRHHRKWSAKTKRIAAVRRSQRKFWHSLTPTQRRLEVKRRMNGNGKGLKSGVAMQMEAKALASAAQKVRSVLRDFVWNTMDAATSISYNEADRQVVIQL